MTRELSKAQPSPAHREARERFKAAGISIKDWADQHGFSAPLVREILLKGRPCVRGQSHQIAVKLGLKPAAAAVCPTHQG